MPLTNGATAAKETGYRVGKSKKNPEMAMDAADTVVAHHASVYLTA